MISAVVQGPVLFAEVVKIADVSPLVSTDQFVQPMLLVSRKSHQVCNSVASKVPFPVDAHPPYSVTKMAMPAASALVTFGPKLANLWENA